MCRSTEEGKKRCNGHTPYGVEKRNLQAKKQYHQKRLENPKLSPIQRTKSEQKLQEFTNKIVELNNIKEELGKVKPFTMNLTPTTTKILSQLEEDGLQPYIVGGSVRDALMGLDSKDVDIEVYGGSVEKIISSLSKVGKVDEVGKSFGVLKIAVGKEDFDISLPRTDSKTNAGGHTGFTVDVNPELSLEEATARRDYTINALMYSHKLGFIIDKHDGLKDLENKQLKHVSEAFDEDPLRVLRGVQMSSRFNMELHPDTIVKAQSLKNNFKELATERVQTEFQKLYSKGSAFDKAFKTLKATGWDENFPGLADVNNKDLTRNLKRVNTLIENGTITKNMREVIVSAAVADKIKGKENKLEFLRMTNIGDDNKNAANNLLQMKAPTKHGAAKIRKWAYEIPRNTSIRNWCALETIRGNKKEAERIYRKAEKIGVLDKAEPTVINGNDLMKLDPASKPGPWLKKALDKIRDAQYDRQFKTREEGLKWVEENFKKLTK